MRSVQRIIGLLTLSLLVVVGVSFTQANPTTSSPSVASHDDCAKKRARGRRCDDDDNRNGNRNGNRNSNHNSDRNGNGNDNRGDDNR